MGVQIRPACDADWPAIWEMFQAVARAGDAFAYDETTSERTARDLWMGTDDRAFVADRSGHTVGTYYLKPNLPGRGSHVANAGYMVAPDCRGQGIARALAVHSIAEAERRGFQAMQFNYVVSTNEVAVRLWKDVGFRIIGTSPGAFRHRDLGAVDVYMMFRELPCPSDKAPDPIMT